MELDFEMLQQIVSMLPELSKHLSPEWIARVEIALEVIGGTSLALAAVKPLVARFVTSPQGRAWWDAIIKAFDLVASNTRGMDLRPLAEPKPKKEKKR